MKNCLPSFSVRFKFLLTGLLLFIVSVGCSKDDESTPQTPSIKSAPCENGLAGNYPCNGYDLQYHLTLQDLGFSGTEGNDSWGWTDPQNSKEYVLMGTSGGTAFVDISNPKKPILIGTLPTATVNSSWRDIKVYKNHAFIVSEADNHGMQVFDLTRLRSVTTPPQQFNADTTYKGIGKAHNIVINENDGYAYITGTPRDDLYNGGATFIDIQDPKNPKAAGGYADDGYSHDAQVVSYNGPDADHQGKEIYIGSNENEVVIVDVTDKSNPIAIAKLSYTNFRYAHQGWFSEDQKYFLLGDELDEQKIGFKTRTLIFDFTDLDAPVLHTEYTGPTSAIDHNGYVKGNTFYQASYTAGVRMIDISDIQNKNMTETGFFDTYPSNNNASFNGAWNVYPFFSSGNIIISDVQGGLFIIKKP